MSENSTVPYTATSLAAAAGVSTSYVASLCREGRITAIKVGPVWLIRSDVGDTWLRERAGKTKPA